jgi:hypothetical protein
MGKRHSWATRVAIEKLNSVALVLINSQEWFILLKEIEWSRKVGDFN